MSATALLLLTGFAGSVAASAATPLGPRAGQYTGQEAASPQPLPVSFTVASSHRRIVAFSAEAEVKAGCKNHITEFQAPTGPMPITSGRFTKTSHAYPQKGVAVTVTGHFTSRTTARGRITVRFTKVRGCNASRLFRAHRTG
ncbi:MAG TPA: hypothetical protein VME70_14395 [Mycobacteriales bacterium]|nr:hypothetical protein [Mycobacteriales bacterium]